MNNIFDWNHISNDISEKKISQLRALYKNFYRLFEAFT